MVNLRVKPRVVVVWCLLFVWLGEQTLGFAGVPGTDPHPLNPNQVGEVVIPSPFDPSFPFPVYIPQKVKGQILEQLALPGDKPPREVIAPYQRQFGVYPFMALKKDETKPAGAAQPPVSGWTPLFSAPVTTSKIQQMAYLKPYADWVIGGAFYQGYKKAILTGLYADHQKSLESIKKILEYVSQKGTLPGFGQFRDQGRFEVSHQAPGELSDAIKAYMEGLYRMHDTLENLLVVPTENVDPDVLLDMTHALGVGPQIRNTNVATQMPLVKDHITRFCATSFLYRYVINYLKETNNVTYAGQPWHRDPDQFVSKYYLEEAKGNDLDGKTLAARKEAYKTDYQRVVGTTLNATELEAIRAVSRTWAVVPQFSVMDPNADTAPYGETIVPIYVPLSAKAIDVDKPSKWMIHASFKPYIQKKAATLQFAGQETSGFVTPTLSPTLEATLKAQHNKMFLDSLWPPSFRHSTLDRSLDFLAQKPYTFLRFKDQYLLHRGVYEPVSQILDQARSEKTAAAPATRFGTFIRGTEDAEIVHQHSGGSTPTANPRGALEEHVPAAVCESLMRRNFATGFLMTHMAPDALPLTADVLDLPARMKPWLTYWKDADYVGRLDDAWVGKSTLSPIVESGNNVLVQQGAQNPVPLVRSMRPWSIYEQLYYRRQRPTQPIWPQLELSDVFDGLSIVDLGLADWLLPGWMTRFGRLDTFIQAIWHSDLGVLPKGELKALRPDMVAAIQRETGSAQHQFWPYVFQNMFIEGAVSPSASTQQSALEGAMSATAQRDALHIQQMQELIRMVWRSRVLFTPWELVRMIQTYFAEMLLPLAAIERFLPRDSLSSGNNSAVLERLKRFFMNAGTVHYELIHQFFQSETGSLMRVQSGFWDDAERVFSQDLASAGPDARLTKSGWVVSYAGPWQLVQRDPPTVANWSIHDRFKKASGDIDRVLAKRVLWCKNLPDESFVSVQDSVRVSGKPLSLSSIRELVCSLPALFHPTQAFEMFLAKEHLRYQSLKDYFNLMMARENEERKYLVNLGHLGLPDTLSLKTMFGEDEDSQPETPPKDAAINLRQGIHDFSNVSDLYLTFRKKLSTTVKGMFNNDNQPNWDFAVGDSVSMQVDDTDVTIDISYGQFDDSCNYQGETVNVLFHPKVTRELKMLCLFRRAKAVRNVLVQDAPYSAAMQTGGLSDLDAIKSQTQNVVQAYITRLATRLKDLKGTITGDQPNCEKGSFQLTTSFQESATGTDFAARFKRGMTKSVNSSADTHFGGFIRKILEQTCKNENNPQLPLSDTIAAWSTIAAQAVASKSVFETFFGSDVLFERAGDKAFQTLAKSYLDAHGALITLVDTAHKKRTGEDYVNLKAELGDVFRDLKLENLVRSLVAAKVALNDKAQLDPISNALPSDRRYALEIQKIDDVGELDIFSSYTNMRLYYNRNTKVGYAVSGVMDVLGMGTFGRPGTYYIKDQPTGIKALGRAVDGFLCDQVTKRGGRFMPWLTNPDGSLQLLNYHPSTQNPEIVSPGYYCRLKRAHPLRPDFKPLSAYTKTVLNEANLFLSGVSQDWENTAGKRHEARRQLEDAFFQAVVIRVFLDKLLGHVVKPYQAVSKAMVELFEEKIKPILQDASLKDENLKFARALFAALKEFADDDGKEHLKLAYFKQLFVSMVTALFPDGDLRNAKRADLITKFLTLYGNPAHIKTASSPTDPQQEEDKPPKGRGSILFHINRVTEGVGALVMTVMDKLMLHYPMLEEVRLTDAKGEAQSLKLTLPKFTKHIYLPTSQAPKRYQLMFVTPVFDLYRPSDAKDATDESMEINGTLADISTFYEEKQDAIDQALDKLVSEYPFDPNHALTHRLDEEGSDFNPELDSLWFLGDHTPKVVSSSPHDHESGSFFIITHREYETREVEDEFGDVVATFDVPKDPNSFAFRNKVQILEDRTQKTRVKARNLEMVSAAFPWLAFYKHSLAHYMAAVVADESAKDSNEMELFPSYLEANAGADTFGFGAAEDPSAGFLRRFTSPLWADVSHGVLGLMGNPWHAAFREGGLVRQSFRTMLHEYFVAQAKEIKQTITDTIEAHYEGRYVSEIPNSGREADLAQDKTLVQLFSNVAFVNELERRFGDRFLEIQHEFVPYKVMTYYKEEQAYLDVMADIGKIAIALLLGALVCWAARGVIGLIAKVGPVSTLASKLPGAACFMIRHAAAFGLAVLGNALLFSAIGGMGFSAALLLTLVTYPLVAIGMFASSKEASLWFQRLFSGIRWTAWDFFVGVIVLDVFDVLSSWEMANQTSAAYGYYAGLFYSYMRLPRMYRTLYREAVGTAHTPLLSDTSYLAYRHHVYRSQYLMAVMASVLALVFNSRSAWNLIKKPLDLSRAEIKQLKAFLKHIENTKPKSAKNVIEALRSDPQQYLAFLIRFSDKLDDVTRFIQSRRRWFVRRVVPKGSAEQILEDAKGVQFELLDGRKVGLKDIKGAMADVGLNVLDGRIFGTLADTTALELEALSTVTMLRGFQPDELGGVAASLIQETYRFRRTLPQFKSVSKNVHKQFLAKAKGIAVDSVKLPMSPNRWIQELTPLLRERPQLVVDLVNDICAGVFKATGKVEKMVEARFQLMKVLDRMSGGRMFGGDPRVAFEFLSAADLTAIGKTLEGLGGNRSTLETELSTWVKNPDTIGKVRVDAAQKFGFGFEVSHFRSIQFMGKSFYDAFGDGGWSVFGRISDEVRFPDQTWVDSPLFKGEIPPVDTRMLE